MIRRKTLATGVATAVVSVAAAGGLAFGMGQLSADDEQDRPVANATSTSTSTGPATTSTPRTSTPSTSTSTEQPTATPTKTASPTPTPMFSLGDEGDGVRELQARLKQIRWYTPDVTGRFDDVTLEAVEGFQAKRGLPVTGDVDDATWQRLLDMTSEPTEDEKHNRLTPGPTIIGPGDTGDDVRELQARLAQIGWFDHEVTGNYGPVTSGSVSGFQTKRGFPSTGEVDQRTWDRLVSMTRQPTDDELYNREPETGNDTAAALDPRCQTGRVLCIDKTNQALSWVIDGQIHTTVDVRFGAEQTPTREGQFSVYWKSRDHVSSLYDTPMPFAMFFDGGQAVHYSPDFAANGYNGASHGCVNVRDRGTIESLFDQVRVGDKVVIYWS